MAEKTKTLYRIKGLGGEFNASAAIRVAAGALQMTLDQKENKVIRKWIDENVDDFKWSQNWPAQIIGALKKTARGDSRPGKRERVQRDITAERLAAAIALLQRLDNSIRHKAFDAEIAASLKALDALSDQPPDGLDAFVCRYGGPDKAADVVDKVGSFTPFTVPKPGTPDHAEMVWVVKLAAEDKNLEKLKKSILAVKVSPVAGFITQFSKLEHAKAALEAVKTLVHGDDPETSAD